MRGVIIFIITLLIVLPSYGETIDQVVSEALDNNPEILASQKNWAAARSKVTVISTWPDPQAELMYEQIPQSGGSLNDAQMKMYGLSQMIPFPGRLTLKRWAEEDAAKMAEEKYQAKIRDVVAKVKSAYYMLFLVDKSIQINQENEGLLKKFARIAEAKYVVGKATQHDVLKAQVELSLLSNELITLRQKRQTAQARLKALLNRNDGSAVVVDQNVNLPTFTLSLSELEQTALENRPELRAKAFGLRKREKDHTLAKMKFLPDFKLKVLQREMKSMGLDGWNVSLMANLPLWFWKQGSGISVAGAKREAAEAAYHNMRNMVRFEVQDAYVKVDSSQRLVELFATDIVPQAEQAEQAAERAYSAEKIDFLSLINAQKTLMEVRLKHFKTQAAFGTSLANLERIIGGEIK